MVGLLLDFLEDFFFLDLFFLLVHDVDEEELDEYQLLLEEQEELEELDSEEEGSEGSMGDCRRCSSGVGLS